MMWWWWLGGRYGNVVYEGCEVGIECIFPCPMYWVEWTVGDAGDIGLVMLNLCWYPKCRIPVAGVMFDGGTCVTWMLVVELNVHSVYFLYTSSHYTLQTIPS
jgi:hypothetical protein